RLRGVDVEMLKTCLFARLNRTEDTENTMGTSSKSNLEDLDKSTSNSYEYNLGPDHLFPLYESAPDLPVNQSQNKTSIGHKDQLHHTKSNDFAVEKTTLYISNKTFTCYRKYIIPNETAHVNNSNIEVITAILNEAPTISNETSVILDKVPSSYINTSTSSTYNSIKKAKNEKVIALLIEELNNFEPETEKVEKLFPNFTPDKVRRKISTSRKIFKIFKIIGNDKIYHVKKLTVSVFAGLTKGNVE
ncbi:16262_t:CDS:2, partial [Racocetra persica]